MSIRRTHVVLSEQLVKDIDAIVGSRQRSSFLTEAAEKELMRRRQMEALKGAVGAWKDADHPELAQGADKYIQKLRLEGERRIQAKTRT
jgi:metal-responsive CopG/Arc/MetJ family transcriptional regulator